MKLLLDKANVEGIRFYEAYRKNGGYSAVEKAFKMSPADIVEEVKKVDCAEEAVQVFHQV